MEKRESPKTGVVLLSIAIGLVIAMFIGVILGNYDPESHPETTKHEEYHIYRTSEEGDYLEFLENANDNQYSVIDISISINAASESDEINEFYIITYKTVESD